MIESLLDWISEHAQFEAESGTNNYWNWVKYTDGTSKAKYKRTLRLNFDTQYGGIYFSSQVIEEIYPQNVFTVIDSQIASTNFSGVGGVSFGQSNSFMTMRVWNGTAGANLETTIMAVIEGRWK